MHPLVAVSMLPCPHICPNICSHICHNVTLRHAHVLGAIFVQGKLNMDVLSCSFTRTQSKQSGGGALHSAFLIALTIVSSVFEDCLSKSGVSCDVCMQTCMCVGGCVDLQSMARPPGRSNSALCFGAVWRGNLCQRFNEGGSWRHQLCNDTFVVEPLSRKRFSFGHNWG